MIFRYDKRSMGIHWTRSCQNSESDPERHTEQNDTKKLKHSQSVPNEIDSQYIFRMDSISQFAQEEPLQADSYISMAIWYEAWMQNKNSFSSFFIVRNLKCVTHAGKVVTIKLFF